MTIIRGLANDMDSLLFSGVFSDLTLTCGGRKFEVHRVILYTQSEYFRKLLDCNFKVFSTRRTSSDTCMYDNRAAELTKAQTGSRCQLHRPTRR